jgi:Protein of unknown function (DUF3617)
MASNWRFDNGWKGALRREDSMTLPLHRGLVAFPVIALSLAACSSQEPEKAATVAGGTQTSAEMSAAAVAATDIVPGQYDTRIELIRFDMPGVPMEMAAQMRQQMETQFQQATSVCLTPEQARGGRQARLEDMAKATNGQCRADNLATNGDRVTGRMICNGGPGGAGAATVTFEGTLGAESSDMTISTTVTNPMNAGQPIVQVMRVTSRRTGECTGSSSTATVSSTPSAPAPTTPSYGKPAR